MSMNVNQDYSQFYAGTEQIKSYGSNPAAKYGLNGSVSDSGKVIYNVQEGQVRMSGAPGSYVDMESWLKANDTELYDQINELNRSIINHQNGENHSAKFIELYTKAAKKICKIIYLAVAGCMKC